MGSEMTVGCQASEEGGREGFVGRKSIGGRKAGCILGYLGLPASRGKCGPGGGNCDGSFIPHSPVWLPGLSMTVEI